MPEFDSGTSAPSGDTTVAGDDGPRVETTVERGTAVDRYIVLDRLGAGAMGAVYRAFDPRLDRQVAVKLLHPRADGDREDLLDEARTLAQLSHANVVAVFDAGLFRDTVFITMERIEGETLDDWLAARRRDWREILGVLLGSGRGLSAAHKAGAVHRDFKPKNVMVDTDGVAKVMDFGLAALANTQREGEPRRGRPQGTPLYMAPEQHMGESATFAADQYAFCVVAYEALTGKHPRADARSVGALLDAISRPPPPLSCPGLPAKVRAAIERGMSPDPEQRWPSMDALLEVVAGAFHGTRSRWLGVATVATLVGVAVAASRDDGDSGCPDAAIAESALMAEVRRDEIEAVLSSFDADYGVQRAALVTEGIDRYAERWAVSEADACRAAAASPRERAENEATAACLQRHRNDFLGAVGVLYGAAGVERVRAADLLDGLADPQSCLDGSTLDRGVVPPTDAQADAVAELRQALAELRAENAVGRWVQVAERVEPLLSRAWEIAYMPLVAEALWVRGEAHRLVHAIPEAEASLSDAAWMAVEYGDERLALDAAVSLVALRRDISETDVNRRWAERARRLIRGGTDPAIEGELELHMSVATRNIGAWDDARKHADAAVSAMRRVFGEEHPRYADARHVLGAAMLRQDALDAALEVAVDNLELRERLLGPKHPSLVDSLLLVGVIQAQQTRHDAAVEAYLRAAEIQRNVVGPRTRILAGVLNNLGSVYTSQGKTEAARAVLSEAVDIWRELKQQDSLVYGLVSLGGLALHEHEPARMLRLYEEAWALMESAGGQHPMRGPAAAGIAASHICLGDFDASREWIERAEAGKGAGQRVDNPWLSAWRALLAEHDGDKDVARSFARTAVQAEGKISIPDPWWGRVTALASEAVPEPVPSGPLRGGEAEASAE